MFIFSFVCCDQAIFVAIVIAAIINIWCVAGAISGAQDARVKHSRRSPSQQILSQ